MHDHEFAYRLAGHHGGRRPGVHAGRGEDAGQLFAGHRRLFDHPDPRRIDVRASLRDVRGEWLVRLARQRVAVPVHTIVDVSASMHLGAWRRKLDVVADFVAGLGLASFRVGDPLGMIAFDGVGERARADLHQPPRRGRGVGAALCAQLRALQAPPATRRIVSAEGLLDCAQRLGGTRRDALVFIASDFHGIEIDRLATVLDALWPAQVVPLLVWHPQEAEPPASKGLMAVEDAESGRRRSLWLRASLRTRWRDAASQRHEALKTFFLRHDCPLHELVARNGRFDAEALTHYFLAQCA